MSLTEKEKQKITEEEEYRKKVREQEAYRAQLHNPPPLPPKSNKKGIGCLGVLGIFIIVIIVAFLVILSAINPSEQTDKAKKVQLVNLNNNQYVFDVPALVGKDLDGVITTVGKLRGEDPTPLQIKMGVREWDKTYVKDGEELLITYTIYNRKIIDFFVSADDNPSGGTTNKDLLLHTGHLQYNDPRYKLEFVQEIGNPSVFTGVKVIPN